MSDDDGLRVLSHKRLLQLRWARALKINICDDSVHQSVRPLRTTTTDNTSLFYLNISCVAISDFLSIHNITLDFIPTSLVKACSGTFSPILARLANLSFEHETFPSDFKVAQVTPLLKKRGLHSASPSSYRPISNLNTISKIIERLVMTRIVPHVSASPSYDPVQSAYRKHHSTETALLKITDDIFFGLGARQSTVLVALDQSAAFDCVDHGTFIRRLTQTFGSGKALGWIESYLDSRSCFVRWRSHSSATSLFHTGDPQGSVLGPLLFSLYIAPLSGVISSFSVNHHQYADDTQIYITVSRDDLLAPLTRLERCTAAIHQWLQSNGLQLNPDKSEVLCFDTGAGRRGGDELTSVRVSGTEIQLSSADKSSWSGVGYQDVF